MKESASNFPKHLPEPEDYHLGVDVPVRPLSRNVLVFMREDRANLQQMHFQNRSHHRHVLIMVLDTAGAVIVDGIETRLRPGQGLLVLPFQFHHYINLEAENLRWLFITFELVEGSVELDTLGHRVIQPDSDMLSVWTGIAKRWQLGNKTARVETLPLLDLLLLKLQQSMPEESDTLPVARSRGSWIARVEALIREAVDQHWTLDEVARRSGLSERQLRTRFEAESGVTIRHYRANYQLHRSFALMRGSQASIADIAERVGFQSSAAFCRFIRRETGMSPIQLRRTL